MKNYLYLILLLFFTSNCYTELSDIEQNLLHNEEISLFEIDSFSVLYEIPELTIRVFYTTKFFELTEQQQEKLFFVKIFKNDEKIHVESMQALDENSDVVLYFDDIVEPGLVCYNFFFSGSSNSGFTDSVTRDIELCIDI